MKEKIERSEEVFFLVFFFSWIHPVISTLRHFCVLKTIIPYLFICILFFHAKCLLGELFTWINVEIVSSFYYPYLSKTILEIGFY